MCCGSSTKLLMASMHSDPRKVILGSVGELMMYGLTVPGLENARDPLAQVCLSVADALKLLLVILESRWKLDTKTQAALLGISTSTLNQCHKGNSAPLTHRQIDRITDLLRCYKSLRVLLPREDSADTWISRPNDRFYPSPVAYMLQHGTKGVRRYLESEHAG